MEDFMAIEQVETKKEETPERRKKLVTELQNRVDAAKGYHETSYKQMKKDMDAAMNGFDDSEWTDSQYVANILQRHVQQRTASLYAKNPKAQAKRRERMNYEVWDGDEKSLKMAYDASMMAAQSGMPIPPSASMIIEDYTKGQNHRKMLDKVALTLEQLFDYYIESCKRSC